MKGLDPADPRQRDLWAGDAYELRMAFDELDGAAQARVVRALVEFADLRNRSKGYVTRLPTGKRVVCGVHTGTNSDDGGYGVLYLPAEALALTDRRVGEYIRSHHALWTDHLRTWFRTVDDWLAAIALRVHEVVPLLGARIGWEHPIGDVVVRGRPPAERSWGLIVVRDGTAVYLPAMR